MYLYHRAFPEIEEEVVVLKVNSTDTIVYTITHAAVRIAALFGLYYSSRIHIADKVCALYHHCGL